MGKKAKVKRVVIDTNVILSALLFKGKLSKIVELWEKELIIPLISKETFNELKRVLGYPKFSLTKDEINSIIEEYILPYFEAADITASVKGVCRDSEDDKFLSCAVSAKADYIISGDMDLCDLKRYRFVKIIKPVEFISMFE
ncbi:MAG: putative toxin-antitoxin system toxin component, PIN family [bacterium]